MRNIINKGIPGESVMFRCVLNLWGYVQLIARECVAITALIRAGVLWGLVISCLVNVGLIVKWRCNIAKYNGSRYERNIKEIIFCTKAT